MPTYRYDCVDCGYVLNLLQTVQEMRGVREELRCQRCEGKMQFNFPTPALNTDTSFMANRSGDGFGNDDVGRKRAYAKARANGINPTGKVWMPQLNAFVNNRADVKRICEQRNLDCDSPGTVTHKARELEIPPEEKRYEVAEDVVQREVEDIVEDNKSDVTPKERKKLVEATRERLRGQEFD